LRAKNKKIGLLQEITRTKVGNSVLVSQGQVLNSVDNFISLDIYRNLLFTRTPFGIVRNKDNNMLETN